MHSQAIEKTKDEVFMLDNSMTAYYARKFRHFYPRYKDWFEIRRRAVVRI